MSSKKVCEALALCNCRIAEKLRELSTYDVNERFHPALVPDRGCPRDHCAAGGGTAALGACGFLCVGQGAARHCGDLLDGGNALSTAALRLSLRGGGRIEAVRDLQGDGATPLTRHHQSRHGNELGDGTLAGVRSRFFPLRLAARQAAAGDSAVRRAWVLCGLRAQICRGSKHPLAEVLPDR